MCAHAYTHSHVYTHTLTHTHQHKLTDSCLLRSKIAKEDVCTPAGYVLFYKLRGEEGAEEEEPCDDATSTNGTQSKGMASDEIYS
jgi:hypothetical protein